MGHRSCARYSDAADAKSVVTPSRSLVCMCRSGVCARPISESQYSPGLGQPRNGILVMVHYLAAPLYILQGVDDSVQLYCNKKKTIALVALFASLVISFGLGVNPTFRQ